MNTATRRLQRSERIALNMTQPMEGSSNHFAVILGFPGPRSLETRMARTASAVAVAVLISCLILIFPLLSQSETQQPPQQTPPDSTPASPPPTPANSPTEDEDKDVSTKPPAEDNRARTHQSPWQLLAEGVESHTVTRRQEALAALGTLGVRSRAIQLVVSALDDKDPSVRQLAARDLGQMHAKSAIPKLREALND